MHWTVVRAQNQWSVDLYSLSRCERTSNLILNHIASLKSLKKWNQIDDLESRSTPGNQCSIDQFYKKNVTIEGGNWLWTLTMGYLFP